MPLVSRPAGAPIPPATRRVAALLAREHTGEILVHLQRRPYLAASEVARLEAIHVATAQRYLRELVEADLVGVRVRKGTTRPTEEYYLRTPRIRIEVDLEGLAPLAENDLVLAAHRLAVRDRGDPRVVYDTNPGTGVVQGVLVLSEAAPRTVVERILVPTAVGRFLTHLPGATAPAASVWAVMQHAGLEATDLPAVLAALGRFSTARVPAGASREPPGARLPDADLEPILERLGPLPVNLPEAAPVPLIELVLRAEAESNEGTP